MLLTFSLHDDQKTEKTKQNKKKTPTTTEEKVLIGR